jgi:uncharacterized protein YaiL (DUF2058 family)
MDNNEIIPQDIEQQDITSQDITSQDLKTSYVVSKRGRKVKYDTDDERIQAKIMQNRAWQQKHSQMLKERKQNMSEAQKLLIKALNHQVLEPEQANQLYNQLIRGTG